MGPPRYDDGRSRDNRGNYGDRRMESNDRREVDNERGSRFRNNDGRMLPAGNAPPRYDDGRSRDNRGDYGDRRMESNDRREVDNERGSRFRSDGGKISKDIPEEERRRLQDERVFQNDRRTTGLREGEWVCKLCSMLLLPYKNSQTPKPKCPRCGVKSLNPWFKVGDWCCPKCNMHNKAGDEKKCSRLHCTYVLDVTDESVGICK